MYIKEYIKALLNVLFGVCLFIKLSLRHQRFQTQSCHACQSPQHMEPEDPSSCLAQGKVPGSILCSTYNHCYRKREGELIFNS